MSQLSRFWNQSFFLPKPTLTGRNLPDESGRITIITGGYAGVGPGKAEKAIKAIRAAHPDSKGRLEFLQLDLGDLSTIKASAEVFLGKEGRLDVLVNNAGVMQVPLGSITAKGHELQMSTNCMGPYLFTNLLMPVLEQTAASSPAGSVRVIWAGSLGINVRSPPNGGLDMTAGADPEFVATTKDTMLSYGMSKVGNLFLASRFAQRHPVGADGKGVLSLSFNPGNLRTELQQELRGLTRWLIVPGCFGRVHGTIRQLGRRNGPEGESWRISHTPHL